MIQTVETDPLTPVVHRTVAAYLGNGSASRLVTMSDAILHLRRAFPGSGVSDCRLTDVIAGHAIVLGLNIELDRGQTNNVSVDRWAKPL